MTSPTYPAITQAVEAIVREHAEKHGLTVAALTGRSRVRPIMYARHEAMWLVMERLAAEPRVRALKATGALFDGRDRATVSRLVKRHEDRMAWEAARDALAARWAAE